MCDTALNRLLVSLIVAIAVIAIMISTAYAGEIKHYYTVSSPEISELFFDNKEYNTIKFDGLSNGGLSGEPSLPAINARLLLPPDSKIDSIRVISGNRTVIGQGYNLVPNLKPVPLSSNSIANKPEPKPDIYLSDRVYPQECFEKVCVQQFRGYEILFMKIYPVQYQPLSGELAYFKEFNVIVHTSPDSRGNVFYRDDVKDRQEVLGKIDNPDILSKYAPVSSRKDPKAYDLLIITPQAFSSGFTPLRNYHNFEGVLTEIHTLESIGSNDPDIVRDYIRNQYLNNGISYVLIGGDDDIIPAKDLYVISYNGEASADVEFNMPADIYFGCLDGTYNFDGDTLWGEVNDGDDSGAVDLLAEVVIGRAPVDDLNEANRFSIKTIRYLSTISSYIDNALMVGEYVGLGGIADYGGPMMEQIIDSCGEDGYFTKGISSEEFLISKLYQYIQSWNSSDISERINNGVHLINHLGHGTSNYAMKLTNTQILEQLTNEDLSFVYSQTCYAGYFDDFDCWGEYMCIKSDYGAFATVLNARYGWGDGYTTDGPSQRFNREFWDAVFNPAENIKEIGRALQDSKEDNLYRINEDCMRWSYYGLNLFGDPTVKLKSPGAWFGADTLIGWAPLEVQFDGHTSLDVDYWSWDFGDSTQSTEQNPIHVFDKSGIYDITMQVNSNGDIYSRTKSDYIVAIADTMKVEQLEGQPGEVVELNIYLHNTIPLNYIRIPVIYYGSLDITPLGVSLEGCRTTAFNLVDFDHFNLLNKQLTIRLEGGNGISIPPGSGPVVKLLFQFPQNAQYGQIAHIDISGYSSQSVVYNPTIGGKRLTYEVPTISGQIGFSSCCIGKRGNVNNDINDAVNVVDLTFLVDYLFGSGDEPSCFPEANVDGDPENAVNVVDLTILVGYLFGGSAEPPDCPS